MLLQIANTGIILSCLSLFYSHKILRRIYAKKTAQYGFAHGFYNVEKKHYCFIDEFGLIRKIPAFREVDEEEIRENIPVFLRYSKITFMEVWECEEEDEKKIKKEQKKIQRSIYFVSIFVLFLCCLIKLFV